jgi:hypothetical protein
MKSLLPLGFTVALGAALGCSASGTTPVGSGGSGGSGAGDSSSSGAGGKTTGAGGGDPIDAGGTGGASPAGGEVYGHSDRTLFKLEPVSKTITTIGNFDCVTISIPGSGEGMWDIAVDKSGQLYGTSAKLQGFSLSGSLVKIDKGNAHCSPIAQGQYPNSLTFVPAGTLDPSVEVLVGFKGAEYIRIDPVTGAQMTIGNLNPNPTGKQWESSGDVVSIIGAKTYLTVKPLGSGSGYAGSDTIVEIDPLTGQATKLVGDTTYPKLWGLGYWGGTAYGFSATGQLCAIDLTSGSATGIPLMNIPAGLAFWGAGVTTAAPTMPPK